MGFFDDFMGKSQRKDIQRANADASRYMEQGYGDARNALSGGYQSAQGQLGQGRNALAAGYTDASGYARDGMGRAVSRLDGISNRGGYQNASRMYGDALGTNGREAQQRFSADYSSGDPFRAQNEDFAQRALAKQYNARGMLNSGTANLAAARASQERGSQDYNSYLDRLMGLAGQGAQLDSQAAGYEMQGGNQQAQLRSQYAGDLANSYSQGGAYDVQGGNALGGLDYQYATDRAGNRINFGNAMASSRTTGINNILGLVGAGASAFGSLPTGNIFGGGGLGGTLKWGGSGGGGAR